MMTALMFSQQSGAITGTVTDQAMFSEPLLFANVQLKGSDIDYQTNFHGNFEILEVKPGTYTVVISYAGYQTEEISVIVASNTVSQLETSLAPMQINFDDVEGMDSASEEETTTPSMTDKSSNQ
jgi:hypothetical protein